VPLADYHETTDSGLNLIDKKLVVEIHDPYDITVDTAAEYKEGDVNFI
jgi:hypothetical protein